MYYLKIFFSILGFLGAVGAALFGAFTGFSLAWEAGLDRGVCGAIAIMGAGLGVATGVTAWVFLMDQLWD